MKRTKRKKHLPLNFQIALFILLFALFILAIGVLENTGYIIGNYAIQSEPAISYTGKCISYDFVYNPSTKFSTDKSYFILHLDNGISVGVYRHIFNIDKLDEAGKAALLSQELEICYIPVHPFPFDDETALLLTMKSQQVELIGESQVQGAYRDKLSPFLPFTVVFGIISALIIVIPFLIQRILRYRKKKEKARRKQRNKRKREE